MVLAIVCLFTLFEFLHWKADFRNFEIKSKFEFPGQFKSYISGSQAGVSQ